MSKFCENCGSELKDTDKVCPNCGTASKENVKKDVKAEKVTASNAETNVPKTDTKKFILIGGIAAAVVIVVILLIALLGGGYKKPLTNYFNGIQKAKSDTYLKAYADFQKEDMEDKYDDEKLEKMLETFEKEYGDKIKISYKVLDKEKMDKEELEDVKDDIEDEYDEDVKITAGYTVAVKITVKGSDDKESNYSSFDIYKINGKWCMVD